MSNEDRWKAVLRNMFLNRIVKDGAYRVIGVDDRRITVERVATGSLVKISRSMVEKTSARLAAGETIPKRGISYTVAIETLVVIALGRSIKPTDDGYVAG